MSHKQNGSLEQERAVNKWLNSKVRIKESGKVGDVVGVDTRPSQKHSDGIWLVIDLGQKSPPTHVVFYKPEQVEPFHAETSKTNVQGT